MARSLKIWFVRQNYPPERGPFRYTYDLAVEMAQRGHKVTVITGLPHYPFGIPYEGFGRFRSVTRQEQAVTVIRLPLIMAPNRKPARRIAGFASFAISLLPYLLFKRRPDVIVASVPPITVGPIAMAVSKLRSIPIVMMLHDVEPLRSFQLRGKDKIPIVNWIVRQCIHLYNRANMIVVPIEDEYMALINNGGIENKIRLISHGINVKRFLGLSEVNCPFKLPKRPGRYLALYLGTMGVAHNVEGLLRAFADRKIRNLPIDLIIVGDGEYAPVCHEIVKKQTLENVRIFPPVPMEWVPPILTKADLLVVSQKPDLFARGTKFYEYLAAGKPLIVNSTGILARTVKEIGNGWIFDVREPDSLEKALKAFIKCSDADKRMKGLLGQEYAEEHYNALDRFDAWENLLTDIVNR